MNSGRWAVLGVALATGIHVAVSVGLTVRAITRAEVQPAGRARASTGLAKGTTLKGVKSDVFAGAQRSLVLAFSSQCSICKSSLPFYQQISAEVAKSSNVKLVIAATDSVDGVGNMLKAQGIHATVVPVQAQEMGIEGTPTLVLCDSAGRIVETWIGKLDNVGEAAVLRLVAAA
jgi:hypothetical protein